MRIGTGAGVAVMRGRAFLIGTTVVTRALTNGDRFAGRNDLATRRPEMAKNEAAGEGATRRLQEAIDRLQEDVTRVEIWAGAVSGFLKPVPSYEAEQQHMLPSRDGSPKSAEGTRAQPVSGPRKDA